MSEKGLDFSEEKIAEAEKNVLFERFSDKKGEMVNLNMGEFNEEEFKAILNCLLQDCQCFIYFKFNFFSWKIV